MINLIETKDIIYRKDGQSNIIGLTMNKWFNQLIKEKLELGKRKGELIYTNDLRGIGKTHELINFAKENGYIVIVGYGSEELKRIYNYQHIYNEHIHSDFIRGLGKDIVVDELVDIDRFQKCENIHIVTGFVNGKTKYLTEDKKFNDKIINTLKSELSELMRKMESALHNSDYGTYKNLVLAFKEVSYLITDMQKNPIE